MVNEGVKRAFALSKQDIYFMIVILMLALTMYWSAIVIDPILDIAETQQDELNLATKQQEEIIENGDNNTALLVELFERQNKLLANQIALVSEVANATTVMEQSGNQINQHISTIIGQSDQISEMITYFRDNFGDRFMLNQTSVEPSKADQILSNVTEFKNEIGALRVELAELKDLLSYRQSLTSNGTTS